MPELSEGLFTEMRRIDGAKFRGHLLPSVGVNTKEKAPYRVLHIRTPTFIESGNTIKTFHGEVLILMEHPDDFGWVKSFKGAYAKDHLVWLRPQVTMHPVAHVKQATGTFTDMGKLYVNMDTPEELKIEGISDTKYRFITGQDVQVNDRIGEFTVLRVVDSLGVKVVYTS
jgi:hypothetical protein